MGFSKFFYRWQKVLFTNFLNVLLCLIENSKSSWIQFYLPLT